MTSIAICFLTDLIPGGEEIQIAPSSSLSSSDLLPGNQFSALVSNIFFVEKAGREGDVDSATVHANDEEESIDGKEGRGRGRGGKKQDGNNALASCPIRVSLLASVLHKKESVPRVMTLASAVFCSEEEKKRTAAARAEDASEGQASTRKRGRGSEKPVPQNHSTGLEEEGVVSFPLRRPLLFRNYRPATPSSRPTPSFSGLMVHHLHAKVHLIDPVSGESQGAYRGPRQFVVRLSGLQETTLTAQQVELLQRQSPSQQPAQQPPQPRSAQGKKTHAHGAEATKPNKKEK